MSDPKQGLDATGSQHGECQGLAFVDCFEPMPADQLSRWPGRA